MADDLAAPAESEDAGASPQPAAADVGARLERAVRDWRDAHIAGGPIARATECWNQLEQALGPLVTKILKEF